MNINISKILIHFVAWLVAPLVLFAWVTPVWFWYAAIGSIVVLCVFYFMYPAIKSLPYAAVGLAIAIFLGYSI